jgi:putative ABC transport system substrate-binding protein
MAVTARLQELGDVRRIGVIMNAAATDVPAQARVGAFVQSLRELGWDEGRNIRIYVQWNAGTAAEARTRAAELAALAPDVVLAASTANLKAVQQATITTPIVFVQVSDPIAQGVVPNLARPGGFVTGFTAFEVQTAGKWLDLLKQVAPGMKHIGVIFNPDTSPPSQIFIQVLQREALLFGMKVAALTVHTTDEIEPAIKEVAREADGGLIFTTDQFTEAYREFIVGLVARHGLPAIYARRGFAEAGGLISYSVLDIEQFRQAATYVDRILRGAKPGDLPVQQPTKYELAINLNTAKALGLTVPASLLAIADQVIE